MKKLNNDQNLQLGHSEEFELKMRFEEFFDVDEARSRLLMPLALSKNEH